MANNGKVNASVSVIIFSSLFWLLWLIPSLFVIGKMRKEERKRLKSRNKEPRKLGELSDGFINCEFDRLKDSLSISQADENKMFEEVDEVFG